MYQLDDSCSYTVVERTRESFGYREWDGSAECLLWLFSSDFLGVCKTLIDLDHPSVLLSQHKAWKENSMIWHCMFARPHGCDLQRSFYPLLRSLKKYCTNNFKRLFCTSFKQKATYLWTLPNISLSLSRNLISFYCNFVGVKHKIVWVVYVSPCHGFLRKSYHHLSL